jgi:hypothetical protein
MPASDGRPGTTSHRQPPQPALVDVAAAPYPQAQTSLTKAVICRTSCGAPPRSPGARGRVLERDDACFCFQAFPLACPAERKHQSVGSQFRLRANATASLAPIRERHVCVVAALACPSKSRTVRRSAPSFMRSTAARCRSPWACTRFSMSAFRARRGRRCRT